MGGVVVVVGGGAVQRRTELLAQPASSRRPPTLVFRRGEKKKLQLLKVNSGEKGRNNHAESFMRTFFSFFLLKGFLPKRNILRSVSDFFFVFFFSFLSFSFSLPVRVVQNETQAGGWRGGFKAQFPRTVLQRGPFFFFFFGLSSFVPVVSLVSSCAE